MENYCHIGIEAGEILREAFIDEGGETLVPLLRIGLVGGEELNPEDFIWDGIVFSLSGSKEPKAITLTALRKSIPNAKGEIDIQGKVVIQWVGEGNEEKINPNAKRIDHVEVLHK